MGGFRLPRRDPAAGRLVKGLAEDLACNLRRTVGRKGDVPDNHPDARAGRLTQACVFDRLPPGVECQVKEGIEDGDDIWIEIQITHVQMEVLYETTSSGVHLVRGADCRVMGPSGIEDPAMRRHFL